MPPTTYTEPKLTAEQRRALVQGDFDFLLGSGRRLFTTTQAAAVIGREADYVRALVEDARLEAHSDSALGERKSHLITRRSLLVYLASTANYQPAGYASYLDALVDELTGPQLDHFIARAQARRKRLP